MKIKRITREQLETLWNRDPEAVVDLFNAMVTAIENLELRIEQLESQRDKDSHNSHKPPSSDGLQRITKSQRTKSDRPSGGQDKHEGSTLRRSEHPDVIVTHKVNTRCVCGHSLERVRAHTIEKRQVFDIPVVGIQVTEHQCEVKECPSCGTTTVASFPAGLTKVVQYGKNIKSFTTYLMQFQLLPSERTKELLQDVFGCSVSEGTLFNWNKEIHTTVQDSEQQIKEQLLHSPVIHADETGIFCTSKLQWLHVASTPKLTFYQIHAKRGTEAMDAIDIFTRYTGTAVHDFWKSYFDYACNHGICNSHLIRELIFVHEQFHQRWAKDLIALVTRIDKSVVRAKQLGKKSLTTRRLRSFEQQYHAIVQRGLHNNPRLRGSPHQRGRKKQSKARNLLERLRDYALAVLAFMYNFDVPFTNNQAERDVRMAKVKQKISGTFRSTLGAEIFCRVRGYISTARKNGLSAFDAISRAFDGNPFVPNINYAE